MEPVDMESTAVASTIVDRLLVQPLACQFMVAIMVIITMILLGLALNVPKRTLHLIEHGSILATAALATYAVSKFPRDLGAMDTKALELGIEKWCNLSIVEHHIQTKNSTWHIFTEDKSKGSQKQDPKQRTVINTKSVLRFTVYILIVGCIVTLEVMLQKSNLEQGLGTVQGEIYLHYLWTVLPATFLNFLSQFFSSVDSNTRALAPYHSLLRGGSINVSLDLNLLRPLLPEVFYQEIKTLRFDAFTTSLAALVASIFTVSISALYQPVSFPISKPVELRTTSTFPTVMDYNSWGSLGTSHNYSTRSSLILDSNSSYTPLVYEDLVFPEFSLGNFTPMNTSEESLISINVTIPALRPRLSCHLYPVSEITARFFYNQTVFLNTYDSWTTNGLAIRIPGEACGWDLSKPTGSLLANGSTAAFTIDLLRESLFAAGSYSERKGTHGCSHFLYVWGNFSLLSNPPYISTSALGCNTTIEVVDVVASYIGPQLQLDPSHRPQAIESTSRLILVDTASGRSLRGGDPVTLNSGILYYAFTFKPITHNPFTHGSKNPPMDTHAWVFDRHKRWAQV
ncbi:hypothetical protein GGS26DRAFT_7193 [Hypomontagnella submonticulosa]|nr:hypothetical protein GGS26DRAFT_7193 [Hypomontagnella submonticulosa]